MKKLTNEEIVTMREVCSAVSKEKKNMFGFYESDDIEQEAFLIAWEVMDKYNGTIPLKNFLYIHLKNRLKTFKRDNYIRFRLCPWCKNKEPECRLCIKWKKKIQAKYHLLQSTDTEDNRVFTEDTLDKEILDLINMELAPEYRKLLRRILDGVCIAKDKKLELHMLILEILRRHGYEE